MTLETLLNLICQIGKEDRLINFATAGSSIYELNSATVKNYPVLFVSPTGNMVVGTNFTTYTITLFYIDRLLSDKSNDIQIHSTAVEVLKNLIKKIEQVDDIIEVEDNPTVQLFSEPEKFSDLCNGAYTTIQIKVLNNSVCPLY